MIGLLKIDLIHEFLQSPNHVHLRSANEFFVAPSFHLPVIACLRRTQRKQLHPPLGREPVSPSAVDHLSFAHSEI